MLTPQLVNGMVVAELPPDPDHIEDTVLREQTRKLQNIVVSQMVHGPCGKTNPKNVCMLDGKCSKNFPKEFCKETIVDPNSYYATYRRRGPKDGGRVLTTDDGKVLDNSFIVPYNPLLLLRYNCHINVELCCSPKAAKYLFKYVTKGSDACMFNINDPNRNDEIKMYQVWKLMLFLVLAFFLRVNITNLNLAILFAS